NGCGHCVCVARGSRSRLFAVSALATIHVSDQNATLVINGDIEEVEQVADNISSATSQDATALHRSVWSRIRRCPMRPSIKGVRDDKVPDAGEAGRVGVSVCAPLWCGRPVVSDRSATSAAA